MTASASGTTRLTLDRDGSITQTSADTTTTAYTLNANSLTTGTGFAINSSTLNGGVGLKIDSSIADLTADTSLLDLEFTDFADTNMFWLRGLDNNGTVNFRITETAGGSPTFQIGNNLASISSGGGEAIQTVQTGAGNNPTQSTIVSQTTDSTSYSSFSAQGDGGVNYRTAFGVGSSGTTANVYANRGYLISMANLNGLTLLTEGSGDDIRFFSDNDTDDYLYMLTGSNLPALYWETGMTTNDAGLRLSASDDTGQMQYRDQNNATWVNFDDLGIA